MMSPGTPTAGLMSPRSPTVGSPTNQKRKAHFSSTTLLLLIFTNGISFLMGTLHASNAALHSTIPKQRQLPNQLDSCPPPKECVCVCNCPKEECPTQKKCPPEKECPKPEKCPEVKEKECPKLECPGLGEKDCPKLECPEMDCPEMDEKECPELECPPEKECPPSNEAPEARVLSSSTKKKSVNPFPKLVDRFAVGMAYATQENFTKTYDLGVPIDIPNKDGDKGVLFIYNTPQSLPHRVQQGFDISEGPLSAKEATENCEEMHVLFSYHEGRRKQCLAIVPQYESYHVQKWLRVPQSGPAKGGEPLRMVPRGYSLTGWADFKPPHFEKHTKKHWVMLQTYLDSIDDIVDELTPVAKKIAVNNTIIVMTCNFGQSQLLLNFACSARARGLDISMVLVFATDQDTKELAESLGMNVYFDERNFGKMPKKAAKLYGDSTFVNMMLSKVICVHMASMLGVDLLFQDADVIWFKNPLEFFHKEIAGTPLEDFDAYFQDDGQHSQRFMPYGANSGFYYFRSNDRTRYFMTSFLMQSDLILRSASHQSAMISLLAEHNSLLGLKVKVLSPFDFPAGFIYHRRRGQGNYGNFFVDFMDGKLDPYIFHMSWTENATNKVLFYRQMDQWYLQDKCMDTKLADIPLLEDGDDKVAETCCAAEPLFSCHFRDKPSTRPCKDSPALDKKNPPSYW